MTEAVKLKLAELVRKKLRCIYNPPNSLLDIDLNFCVSLEKGGISSDINKLVLNEISIKI